MRLEIEDTLYQLTFFNKESLSVNCYFVEEDEELTLIDTSIPGCAEEILEASVQIGKPITKVVLTHVHHDHVGSLDALKQALPNLAVYISARESRLLLGDLSLNPEESNSPVRGAIPKNVQTRPNILLHEGDRIGSLLALDAPGHTPGSMAFFDTRNGHLIAGDAFQIEGGIAVAGQLRPTFPYPSKGTWSKITALKSASKLIEYSPTLLAVGHGTMLKLPMDALTKSIAEATLNLAESSTE
ncbi:glyoxylase-like metal-dependent hydrolase (beta-lactamase superfamily II) [Paenibacillus phyllosphaerae]|uniref:Glyoxylase-like metal-dependent hydrolase (Beta-lactamase superfamily II) n=1 Tax=Paenibacillus phyllosphaerae TaxID=274593 RepID=A0A7W5FP90_9BACL|nr:MBL fold metallo-hydrolase [Paenibacillus phyllosphaerae]MBB3111794.1 glyoxylase-like metal-dependent hydrolase (beta-lactamase superfamily II) [Paenibacillus phyllosphaerae]